MIEAALTYARANWHIFPCAPNGKQPAISGGGGHLDATTDEATIRNWWSLYPDANIGLNLAASGLVAIDVDAYKPDCEWSAWSQGVDVPETYTQRSARGGIHLIFAAARDAVFAGALCQGVEIKHQGYVVVAPSCFDGRPYTVERAVAPAAAPDWIPRRERGTPNPALAAASLADVRAALAVIPNDRTDWDWWSGVAGAVYNAAGGTDEAFAAFDEWSRRCPDYDERETLAKWRQVARAPYTARGMGSLFHLATQANPGWQRPSRIAAVFGAPASATDRIQLVAGRTSSAVDETLTALRARPDVFDLGGAVVRTHGGAVVPLDRHALAHFLGSAIQYFTHHPRRGDVLSDPPARLCDQILSLGAARDLKPLDAVTTIPTLRPDGSVLDVPGYDADARLLYVPAGEPVAVPTAPTVDDMRQAADALLHAFREFPFVGPLDWAVMVAALLTAVIRPAIPTAPGFAFDAPTRGSGKSLLAQCVATLASGETPEPWPHVDRRDDEEVRKRLFAALRSGARVIFWDNLTGVLDSASLAAFLTSSRFQDRVLGKSETLALPNRAVLLLSANNATLAGDMPRRVLTCRIDPRMERAYTRQFEIDPLEYVATHRQALAAAALTIVKAGHKCVPGRVASFERWDDLVRQPIASLTGVDLMDAFNSGLAADPERESLGAMLGALRACFGDAGFTAADVADVVRRTSHAFGTDDHKALTAAITDVAGRSDPTARSIGMILNFRRDRIVDGWRLECRQDRNVKRWFVGLVSD